MRASELAAEADKAALAYQLALAKIGAETIIEAIDMWRRMSPTQAAAAADRWLGEAIQMILSRRGQSQELALAYYRLARALQTGTTVPSPYEREPQYITLDTLRKQFADLIDPFNLDEADLEVDGGGRSYAADDNPEINVDRIEVEDLDFDINDFIDAHDQDALEEAEFQLDRLGPETVSRRLERRDEQRARRKETDQEADRRIRDEILATAEKMTAATAERIVMNGGRGLVEGIGGSDRRVIGWARRSRTGTPCGFCAMLISKSLAFAYGSKAAAQGRTARARSVVEGRARVGDEYHNNCKCVAEPIYSESYFNQSSLFDSNREYEELWPEVTRGKKGRDALNAWRTHFRLTREEQWSQADAAQEDGSSTSTDTTAQEA